MARIVFYPYSYFFIKKLWTCSGINLLSINYRYFKILHQDNKWLNATQYFMKMNIYFGEKIIWSQPTKTTLVRGLFLGVFIFNIYFSLFNEKKENKSWCFNAFCKTPTLFSMSPSLTKLKIPFWRGLGEKVQYEFSNFFGVFILDKFHNSKILKW